MLRLAPLLRLLAIVAARPVLIDENRKEIFGAGSTIWGQHFGSWLIFNSTLGLGDDYALEVRLLEVNEVDLNGNEVGTLQNPHTFSFASSDPQFLFREVQNPTRTGTFGNVSAQGLIQRAYLGRGGALELQAFILREAGSVGPNEEFGTDAAPGDVLLRVNLTSWFFCGHCAQAVCMCDDEPPMDGVPSRGSFIDVLLQVIGYSVSGALADGALELGGGASMEPLGRMLLDSDATSMPMGYPSAFREGSSHTLQLRIPRFQEIAVHDTLLHIDWLGVAPRWTVRDYVIIFGPPAATVLLTIAVICSRVCRPRAAKANYMDKQLQAARRQRLIQEQVARQKLERAQLPEEEEQEPEQQDQRHCSLELPQLRRPGQDRRPGAAGASAARPAGSREQARSARTGLLEPPVELPSGTLLV